MNKCNRCRETKEKTYTVKRWTICAECLNSGPRDKEKRKARSRRYYHNHAFIRLAKAIKKKDKNSKITANDLWRIAKKQKMICPISGRKLNNLNISPDHIIPKNNGGISDFNNIQLVTREVNLAKHILNKEELINLCFDILKFNKKI
jgi:hypothetical protein